MTRQVELAVTMGCHCLAARRAARAITRRYDAALRPHGLRATQFSILAALELHGASPVRRLAEFLGLERTTLTRSAALLEARGWLETTGSDDARERVLLVTPAGGRKLRQAYAAWWEVQDGIDQERDARDG